VRLFAKGGIIGVVELANTGELQFTQLQNVKTLRPVDKADTFRWYNKYELPQGGTLTACLDTTNKDRARKLNHSENVRRVLPSDPDFARLSPM